ncbi:MAG: hypothetical protein FD151_345 [bacterium]|nr:MAG: hypothetical protein FD151_345 [bacterium]
MKFKMFNKIFEAVKFLVEIFRRTGKDNGLLTRELVEVKEIADIIFERLGEKIEALKAIEASVDEKIATFEKLNKTEMSVVPYSESINSLEVESYRQHKIIALKQRGLKIDEIVNILDIPVGEVELILNLYLERFLNDNCSGV